MQFTQGLHRAVQLWPERHSTICNGRIRSFSETADRVARLAAVLNNLGVERGHSVAIQAFNSDRYIEFLLAAAWLGAVAVPVNFRWSVAEVAYSLRDSAASALLLDDQFAPNADAIRADVPSLRNILFIGDGAVPKGLLDTESLMAAATPIPDTNAGGDDFFGVYYTGGTTGAPKGVALSHLNVCVSALSLMAEGSFPEGVVGLHAAPMFHLGDMMLLTCVLLRGGTHVILPAFRPDAALAAIQEHRVTDMLLVPAMLQALVDSPAVKTHDTSTVQRLMYGAAPVSEALMDRALAAIPTAAFTQVYGMTEMSAVMTVLPPDAHSADRSLGLLRSAGRPAYHVMLQILDEEDRPLPAGQVGEIAVRGPNVMRGYLNKPDVTRETLRGGWMHTGDMGYVNEAGYLFIVDRLKDMIITGGENVYSVEVENAIASHPDIAACAVFGVPSPEWGESVHAAIVLKPGAAPLTLDGLVTHCRARIAGFKCPRSFDTHTALPLSGAGKVLKTELRKPYWDGHERAIN